MSINTSPFFPVTAPASFLHIGTDVVSGGITANSVGLEGWRKRMQVGTYMRVGSDNMYVGLKDEFVGINVDFKI